MDPTAWGYFESFLVPVLDEVVSKGNLARAGWTYDLATLVRAPSPQKHISYFSVHSVWPLSCAVSLALQRVPVLRNTS